MGAAGRESFSVPDVSSLLSSWKAERENEAFPRPCFEGVVLRDENHEAKPSENNNNKTKCWCNRIKFSLTSWTHLVRSDAALLLLLVVDSESELERGRRDSLRYTRKLSVTGWFLPSKPLLGNPEEKERERVVVVAVAVRAGAAPRAALPLPLPAGRQQRQLGGADGALAQARPPGVPGVAEEGWCEGREEPRSPPPPPPADSRPPPPPPPPPPSRWCASFRLTTLSSFLSALALRDCPMLCLPELTSSSRACR
ncbi:hypothetical protein EYF80_041525 [Liparis tanakae]|uniref:Uncharacterized protein n=1 Tax=Liparis tanakae TaxID=230148 RepID=A0A4Z2G596_9TELE|nr:hypothetical protein EYF80_041525 [Liparis tanakae]